MNEKLVRTIELCIDGICVKYTGFMESLQKTAIEVKVSSVLN
jgi:hypothetical protein